MITKIENIHVFDGTQMTDRQEIYFDSDGVFTEPAENVDRALDGHGAFLMPGLIDAHTHPISRKNAKDFVRYGVTATCAISAPADIQDLPDVARIYSTHSLALGSIRNGKEFVQNEIRHGAKYIKIVVEDKPRMAPHTIPQEIMNEIADETHKQGLLLATHAVSVPALQMAIDAGTDIFIHVPLEADIPDAMIDQIVKNGGCCVPTLVMMKGFANGIFYGYHKSDYQHAINNVRSLHDAGVPILAGTDANNVLLLPKVRFGSDLHTEMKLLAEGGLSNEAVLQAATANAANGFKVNTIGAIQTGRYADFVLINGNPLADMNDIDEISQVWIGGRQVYPRVRNSESFRQ